MEETLEEAARKHAKLHPTMVIGYKEIYYDSSCKNYDSFKKGANWQAEQDEKKYSEEDMLDFAEYCLNNVDAFSTPKKHLLEQFKKK